MSRAKTLLFITGLFFLITLMVSCQNRSKAMETQVASVSPQEKSIIGISTDSLVIERWKKDVNMLKSHAEELGYQVEVTNCFENPTKQNQQIKNLVDAGAEAIFVIPSDKDSLSESIEYAHKKGVYIIAYDRMIHSPYVDVYISFDNVQVGAYMAEALVEVVPKGNYVIINGAPADQNSFMFTQGYYNVLNPYIETGDITVIHEYWATGWREEIAYEQVRTLLEKNVHIDAIIGANDMLAEGSINALAEYGLVGSIPVVGHDAEVSACQRIVEGKQLMTVYKPIPVLAKEATLVADSLIKGQPLVYDDTLNEVPYIHFDVIPVTAENMHETVIADMFHPEEDIYPQ